MFRNKNKTLDRTYVSEARKLEEIIMADFFFFRGRKLKGTMTSSVSCREVEFMPKEKDS